MHAKVIRAYTEAGFDLERQLTIDDKVEQEFKRKTQGSQLQRKIDQIYRVKHGAKDYIVYNVTEFGLDLAHNEFTHTKMEGVYEMPIFNRQYDNESGEVNATSIARWEKVYTIPFSRRNMQKIINSAEIPSEISFVLDTRSAKFSGLPPYDFMNRHFDDLVDKATTGKFPDTPREVTSDDDVERQMVEARKKRKEAAKAKDRRVRTLDDEDEEDEETEEDEDEEEELPKDIKEAYGAEQEQEPEEAPKDGRDMVERSDKRKATTKAKGGRR
jgi:hypothetical protein